MLNEEMPQWESFGPRALKGSPVTIHLYVENADATFEHAVRAGAKVTMPLADMFWGDRYGKLEDPFGHQWAIATHAREVPKKDGANRRLKRTKEDLLADDVSTCGQPAPSLPMLAIQNFLLLPFAACSK